MGDVAVSVARFVLRERSFAARAPGHHAIVGRQPALAVALGQKAPDALDIGIVVGEVGSLPVHPHPQPLGLGGDDGGELFDARAAGAAKVCDAVFENIGFGAKAQLFFDFDFDPQALTIEAVLPAQPAALHGVEAVEEVFISAAPGVMHAHAVVGGNRPVLKLPGQSVLVLALELVEDVALLPELQHLALQRRVGGHAFKGFKHDDRGNFTVLGA